MEKRATNLFAKVEENGKYQLLLLIVITLVAMSVRFYKLDEWSFWIEETHTLKHSSAIVSVGEALFKVRGQFYLLIKPVLLNLGVSEWSARLLPVLFGVATIPILFWMVKRLFDWQTAFLSAVLLAIAPWHIYWSQNARFYTLLLLLFNSSLFAFYWGIEKDRFRYLAFSALLLILAAATHTFSVILIPIFALYLIFLKVLPYEKPPGLHARNWLPLIMIPLLGYVVFEAYQLFYSGTGLFISKLYSQFFDKATSSYIGYANPYIMLTAVVYYIGTPLTFLTIPGSIYLWQKKSAAGLLLLLGAYGPLAVGMALTLIASTANRYIFMTLPCWIIVAAVGVRAIYGQVQKRKVAAVWIVGMLLLLLRDTVVDDVIYFVKTEKSFGLLLVMVGLAYFLIIVWLSRSPGSLERRGVTIWFFTVLFMLILHPIVMDTLYFAYQHGHRNDWKAVSAVIKQESVEGDMVLSSIPAVASHYLPDREVKDIHGIELRSLLQNNQRVWYVQQTMAEGSTWEAAQEWTSLNCGLVDSWDHFVAGRWWPMRLHMCEPDASSFD